MKSGSPLMASLTVRVVTGVVAHVAKTDAVAPTLWSQPQTKSVEAHPIATTSNTTAPQFYNWALDLYTSQSACGTVAEGWSGDFGTCTWGGAVRLVVWVAQVWVLWHCTLCSPELCPSRPSRPVI
jgi:hypothetical protein